VRPVLCVLARFVCTVPFCMYWPVLCVLSHSLQIIRSLFEVQYCAIVHIHDISNIYNMYNLQSMYRLCTQTAQRKWYETMYHLLSDKLESMYHLLLDQLESMEICLRVNDIPL